MNAKKPRLLLIGAGAFGIKHLATLIALEKKGVVTLAGVVVNTEASARRLKKQYTFPIHAKFHPSLLEGVDAVDIVTPADTHYSLVTQCLPKAHVLVEKPLAPNIAETAALQKQAAASQHILMVGHLFRFHPTVIRLQELLRSTRERPTHVQIEFVNPAAVDNGRDVTLEMLHPFDMMDYLFGGMPTRTHVDDKGRLHVVSLTYRGGIHVVAKIGWDGNERVRTMVLSFRKRKIVCDLQKNTILIYAHGIVEERIDTSHAMLPLEAELRTFLGAMKGRKAHYPDATVGHRIVKIATMGRGAADTPSSLHKKKRVAVIGAGIFGTNCAIELAPFCDVTIFEKNNAILGEASKINQYRHHWGYHYPRSQETVDDISSAISSFENRYAQAIIRKFPTYYSVAKTGSKVTPPEYLAFCDRNNLAYTTEYPGEDFLNRDKIDLCIKTYEPIYDYDAMKRITERLLRRSHVRLCLGQEVCEARLLENGRKALTIKKGETVREEEFDYVINVTYARYNHFCTWMGFPKKPLRLDLVEVLWVKLDIPKISLAVMDGPFTNIVPTHHDGIFTLVHIKESVLRRFVPSNGLVPHDIFSSTARSRIKKIMDKSIEWFPFLRQGKVLDVHYVLRGVNANREHDDARTSDITEHGFGCFSILGGKIINSVATAQEIARLITR